MSENTMYALVKERADRGLTLMRVPVPGVGPNDVKIKIHKTSICGTDLHIYNWDEWSQKTIVPDSYVMAGSLPRFVEELRQQNYPINDLIFSLCAYTSLMQPDYSSCY